MDGCILVTSRAPLPSSWRLQHTVHTHTHTHTHTDVGFYGLHRLSIGVIVSYCKHCMYYCPTPTLLHLNLALTWDCAFLLPPQKTHSVWFISILNYGDTENVLINHILLVIPMSYPCHYTNLCPHKPHKYAHTDTHTPWSLCHPVDWMVVCFYIPCFDRYI